MNLLLLLFILSAKSLQKYPFFCLLPLFSRKNFALRRVFLLFCPLKGFLEGFGEGLKGI